MRQTESENLANRRLPLELYTEMVGRRYRKASFLEYRLPVGFLAFDGGRGYTSRVKSSRTLRRLVGFVAGTALLLSLAAPARAQLDPITLSLMIGGFQLITGAISAIAIGASTDTRTGIALPYGTPCGIVEGVPQICWQPHAGGFEGSPDLPTGAMSAPLSELHPVDSPGPSQAPGLTQGQ